MIAGGSILPRYLTVSGISLPLGKRRNENRRVPKVAAATTAIMTRDVVVSSIGLPSVYVYLLPAYHYGGDDQEHRGQDEVVSTEHEQAR